MEARSLVTLRAIARIAARLYRARMAFLAAAILSGAWFGVTVFSENSGSTRSLFALALFLWSALALGTGCTLSRLPPAPSDQDPWARRMRKRLIRAAYALAVLTMLTLGAFAAFLSIRVVSLALG